MWKSILFFCFQLFTVTVFISAKYASASVAFQDLGGNQWTASGTTPPSKIILSLLKTQVPGCVHTDWITNQPNNLTHDPYYRFNDASLKWIAESDWRYSRTFKVDDAIMNTYEQWLIFEGLDTVATITLNGRVLGKSYNMFVTYGFNVTGLLQTNFNMLEVSLSSAVRYVQNVANTLSYDIPPDCPPDVQHGFCHVNLIRKEQSSFSWDWGPAFATQGIWKPVYLMSLNYAVIRRATAIFDWDNHMLNVDVRFLLVMFANHLPLYGNVSISVPELNVEKIFSNITLQRTQTEITDKSFSIDFSDVDFERWWPNGYGDQKLYNISVSFHSSLGDDQSHKHFMFGFRKVELVQEAIKDSTGLSFYFRINDLPIFAKGANWIPADAFNNRVTVERYENLLKSAKSANMNMLRVWGGGVYENEEFYLAADRLGIMLWQDFMFACAMYPATDNFLSNVTQEIDQAMWSLKHHPSIVIWAGNNENEAALSTDWYNTTEHFDRYKQDYLSLYVDTVHKTVKSLDTTRPFATSSPSNGLETKQEGWVAKNPYDPNNGDVHYYNYNDDCLDITKYPATRFASEYGFQSWPSFETIVPVTVAEDRKMNSNWSDHRQHHATGNQEMLNQIAMHFNMPNVGNSTQVFKDTIYLTQIMQGLCYKAQTEFYRKSRNETVNGAGHTMGALYWQLNDIWQAPTWSSIEYGGKWKALHYFATKFFAPISLIMYDDDTILKMYAASDVNNPVYGTMVLTIRSWISFGFTGQKTYQVNILPHRSVKLAEESLGQILHEGGCPYKEVCYLTLEVLNQTSIPMSFFFPVALKDVDGLGKAVFTVEGMAKSKDDEFRFVLRSTSPALFVWLEAKGIKGRFSENAFTMPESAKSLTFYSWQKDLSVEKLKNSLEIKSLYDIYKHNTAEEVVSFAPSDIVRTSAGTWLDDVHTKLIFGIVGFLFIVIASAQVICLVLRLNKPIHRPRKQSCVDPNLKPSCQNLHKNSSVSSWASGGESTDNNRYDDDGPLGFLIQSKSANGEVSKKTEIRFYII
ncbi:beta-mannosidase-like isoform X2 [Clavelina lepadiformis]|uniref:beta-mannosidase-like isoform X2 n=1 Tax=Clavelina lepadiformis TaxID=159417 RepID=UPI004042999E